ncbi:hypothetical protein WICPIJ_008658 [Wickerhamomyces pijperi]|uniref:RRM domain-containing protein n=1 Tax=Wickerhamomyces pijperi TaxID=599730 RepID=A0A9P8PX64_WICPI|nr:hypothetical protein WICPIJ_008658 [Wickerhamomyces pijperi]
MPPKKNIKMDLSTFLEDNSFGGSSWADDDIDFNAVGQTPTYNAVPSLNNISGPSPLDPAFGGRSGGRGIRESFPIPDVAPFKARINNLPWDAVDEEVFNWVSAGINDEDAIIDIVLPKDRNDESRLAGFGFITFLTKDQLKHSLALNATQMNGRNVYIEVAAPERSERRPRREEVELDWGSARSGAALPEREDHRGERAERRPRREEPEFDWGAARSGASLPPREDSERSQRPERTERKPRREEPEFDWSAARSGAALPPRERSERPERTERTERKPRREEPEFDWSAARSGATLPPRERSERSERPERTERTERKPKRDEPELDWGAARSATVQPSRSSRNNSGASRSQSNVSSASTESTKPAAKKSAFSVLSVDDEEEELSEKVDKLSV